MTEQTIGSTARFDTLDGMRGVAAISVMFGHFMLQKIYIFGHPFVPFVQSALAVDLFFVLSGFVLSHAYAEKLRQGMTYRDLVTKRFIRLYPLFLTGLALGTLTLVILIRNGSSDLTLQSAVLGILLNLGFLPAFGHATIHDLAPGWVLVAPIFPANPPSWSLFFEMVASLALPWLVPRGTRVLAVIAAACWAGFVVYGIHAGLPPAKIGFNSSIGWNTELFVGGFFRVGFGFVLGMILYRYRMQIGAFLERRLPSAFRHPAVIYALTFAMLANPLAGHGLMAAFNLLVAIPFLVAVGTTAATRRPSMQQFSAWLGYLSYPLYCLHFAIGRIVTILTGGLHLSGVAFTFVAGTLSILAAVLAGRLIDEPSRKMLTRVVKSTGKPGLRAEIAEPSL